MLYLDKIDHKILHELSRNARISNVELANRVGLSPSACLRRVQELEKTNIINGYHAHINAAAIGRNFIAYVTVGLSCHNKTTQKTFEAAMATAPQVRECHNIAGVFEYLLRVEVANLSAYKEFHTEILGVVPNVSAITSYVVLETSKDERG